MSAVVTFFTWKPTGGAYPIQEQTYQIAVGMEAAVKEYLHEGE
jgi:hypothetical protein